MCAHTVVRWNIEISQHYNFVGGWYFPLSQWSLVINHGFSTSCVARWVQEIIKLLVHLLVTLSTLLCERLHAALLWRNRSFAQGNFLHWLRLGLLFEFPRRKPFSSVVMAFFSLLERNWPIRHTTRGKGVCVGKISHLLTMANHFLEKPRWDAIFQPWKLPRLHHSTLVQND